MIIEQKEQSNTVCQSSFELCGVLLRRKLRFAVSNAKLIEVGTCVDLSFSFERYEN